VLAPGSDHLRHEHEAFVPHHIGTDVVSRARLADPTRERSHSNEDREATEQVGQH